MGIPGVAMGDPGVAMGVLVGEASVVVSPYEFRW